MSHDTLSTATDTPCPDDITVRVTTPPPLPTRQRPLTTTPLTSHSTHLISTSLRTSHLPTSYLMMPHVMIPLPKSFANLIPLPSQVLPPLPSLTTLLAPNLILAPLPPAPTNGTSSTTSPPLMPPTPAPSAFSLLPLVRTRLRQATVTFTFRAPRSREGIFLSVRFIIRHYVRPSSTSVTSSQQQAMIPRTSPLRLSTSTPMLVLAHTIAPTSFDVPKTLPFMVSSTMAKPTPCPSFHQHCPSLILMQPR